jgi:hypothetical protein
VSQPRYVLMSPGDTIRVGDEYLSFDNYERDGHAQWRAYDAFSFGGVLREETIARTPYLLSQAIIDGDPVSRGELTQLRADLQAAETALQAHGYRKSCDIPACNCGEQWMHGGRAEARLQEILDALGVLQGKTMLAAVESLVAWRDNTEAVLWQFRYQTPAVGGVACWSDWFTCANREHSLRSVKSYCDSGFTAEWRPLGVLS